MCEVVTNLISAIIGGAIGGGIGVTGALTAVRRTDYYQRASILRTELWKVVEAFDKCDLSRDAVPINAIKSPTIDNIVADIKHVIPITKRNAFSKAWEEYRYKEIQSQKTWPTEYLGSAKQVKKIIEPRVHKLISILN